MKTNTTTAGKVLARKVSDLKKTTNTPDASPAKSESGPSTIAEKVSLGKTDPMGGSVLSKSLAGQVGGFAGMAGAASVLGVGNLFGVGATLAGAGVAASMMTGSVGLIGGVMGAAVGAALGVAAASPDFAKMYAKSYSKAKAQRTKNKDGRFRTKSGKTQVDTLRETYGENFAAGLPGNMPLQVLRAATGTSLTQMVKDPKKIDKARPKLAEWEAPEAAPGGRTRNADGRIRQKRGDTKIDTLRKQYGPDLMAQLPGNWPLALVREVTGMSLSKLVENPEKFEDALPKIAAAAVAMDEALDLAGRKEGAQNLAGMMDDNKGDKRPGPGVDVDIKVTEGSISLRTDGKKSTEVVRSEGPFRRTKMSIEEGKTQTETELSKTGRLRDGAISNSIKVTTDNESGKILNIEDNHKPPGFGVDLNRNYKL